MSTYSLKDYGDLFLRLNLSQLSVEDGDFKLHLEKDRIVACESSVSPVKVQETQTENEPEPEIIEGTEVKAPLLGVFYASNGDREKVNQGDRVKKGDVICTIEAMKMMNDVKSPVDGIVKKVCVTDGALVEYDQVLFVIEE